RWLLNCRPDAPSGASLTGISPYTLRSNLPVEHIAPFSARFVSASYGAGQGLAAQVVAALAGESNVLSAAFQRSQRSSRRQLGSQPARVTLGPGRAIGSARRA